MEEYLIHIIDYLRTQSWQIAVLVAVVAAVSLVLKNRSAHVRYLLWLIVLGKCLVPPLISVPLAILPEDKPVVMPITVDTTVYEPVSLPSAPIVMPAAPTVVETPARFTMRHYFGFAWIMGAAVFVLAAGIRALRTNLWLWRERRPLPGELHERIATSFSNLEFTILPRVWLVEGIGQPFVWGLLRGGIYLPADFVKVNSGEHRRDVLGHELSHVLRFDAAVNLLQIIGQAIFWFHPFVWWANRKIRAEREKCCDEMAIAHLGTKAKDYSSAIVDTLITEYESTRAVPSLAVAGPVKNIEERIKTIMRPGKRFYKRPTFAAAIAVLLLAAIAVPTTLALTRRQADKTDAQAEQAKREADEEIQQRVKSVERLMNLGKALLIYANDYEDRYPDNMRQLESYYVRRDAVDEFRWLENVRYLGKGKSLTVPPDVAIAYDRTLLETGKGTNVLFNDCHVEFVEYGRLEEFGIAEESNIKVLDVGFEPIREGKNVVHAEVRNTSPQDQMLGVYIQTRSPDRGWGTTFTDTIKAGQTKWIRHAYKIFDSITPNTWVRLQFYNPGPAAGFDQEGWFSRDPWDSWFKKVKYFGDELEHYRSGESQPKPASKSQAQAITRTLQQLQHHIRNKDYRAAWQLFTQDFREAEFQRRGFERFKECMENPQRFYLNSMELLALEPKSVNIQNGVFTLTASMRDEYRRVDLLNVDGKLRIDSIERVIPSELEVLDVKFEPIRQGKNVVHLKVKNTSGEDQTFGLDIRAEAPIRNWQRQFLETIKGNETKSTSFDFEILGPITDAISIRLRFYNPASADEFDIDKWFKKIRYSYKDLDELGILGDRSEPASESQAEAIRNTFKQFQSHLRGGDYEAVWRLLAEHIRSDQLQGDFEKFKRRFSNDSVKTVFLNLYPESVTKSGKFLTLSAKHEDQTWKIHFIKEDGQWKIYEGQEPDTSNWQERLLPKMQKHVTRHFDIYYFKDSTAEREIDTIAEQKEKGFEQICQFLGKDSDVRIRMVFFEDGETKQRQTGHQGAGWAFGTTIVEIYNEEEKLDPYHETTHILMRPFGNPPALFNEGFAVYMSERLGAHALKNLGGGLARIHQRAGGLREKGEWIDLEELVTYTEIGSRESRPPISYAEAASFVKFLIDNYGKDRFLRAYKALKNSNDKRVHKQNAEKLADIYGKSLQQLDKQWHDTLGASPSASSTSRGLSEDTDASKLLHQAAADGDIEQVKSLIAKGADVNAKGAKGRTALHFAVRQGHRDIAVLLINKGADVNAKEIGQWTPLHCAVRQGHRDIAALLISKGADVNAQDRSQRTPLHYAVWEGRRDIVALLVTKGAAVNSEDEDGKTPVVSAMAWRDPDHRKLVEFLVASGARVAPIHLAAYLGDIEKIRTLIKQGATVDSEWANGRTPLHTAAGGGQTDVARYLISKGADIHARDEWRWTPLHYAARSGDEDVADLLIAEGADVNSRNRDGGTALRVAAWTGHADVAKLLLANGAGVSAKGSLGHTPLHATAWGAGSGTLAVAELLIDHGADLHGEDEWYNTPLHEAATNDRGRLAELLIAKGADVNAADKEGRTALTLAKEKGHKEIVELLRRHGAKE